MLIVFMANRTTKIAIAIIKQKTIDNENRIINRTFFSTLFPLSIEKTSRIKFEFYIMCIFICVFSSSLTKLKTGMRSRVPYISLQLWEH